LNVITWHAQLLDLVRGFAVLGLDNVFLLEFLGCEFVSCLLAFGYPSFSSYRRKGEMGLQGTKDNGRSSSPSGMTSKKSNSKDRADPLRGGQQERQRQRQVFI
jgi:hypothetical protein